MRKFHKFTYNLLLVKKIQYLYPPTINNLYLTVSMPNLYIWCFFFSNYSKINNLEEGTYSPHKLIIQAFSNKA